MSEPEERFGPNGAVMDRMPGEQRAEHEAASRSGVDALLPVLVSVGIIMAIVLIGVVAMREGPAMPPWWAPPPWAWPAFVIALMVRWPVSLVRATWRRLRGGRFFLMEPKRTRLDAAMYALPFGVGIAVVVDAVLQRDAWVAAPPLP